MTFYWHISSYRNILFGVQGAHLENFRSVGGWKITFYSRRRCPRKWRWLIRPLLFAYMDMCVVAAAVSRVWTPPPPPARFLINEPSRRSQGYNGLRRLWIFVGWCIWLEWCQINCSVTRFCLMKIDLPSRWPYILSLLPTENPLCFICPNYYSQKSDILSGLTVHLWTLQAGWTVRTWEKCSAWGDYRWPPSLHACRL